MKRLIGTVIAALILLGPITGCGKKKQEPTTKEVMEGDETFRQKQGGGPGRQSGSREARGGK